MKTIFITAVYLLVYSFTSAQQFTYPSSGSATANGLTAADGVKMTVKIRSAGCIATNGVDVVYSTAHQSAGALHRGTSWQAGCKGSVESITLDFSSVSRRPLGIQFKICDVDNGSDSVSVQIFSEGAPINYTHILFANSFVTAAGVSPHMGFAGSAQNNSGLDDDRGSILITTSAAPRVDSIVIHKYNNRDISGSPSQSFAAITWQNMIVLPLKLANFSVSRQSALLRASWSVQSISSGTTFQLQCSKDGRNFESLGAAVPETYRSLETQIPRNGAELFRLMAQEPGKPAIFSNVVALKSAPFQFSVYPNPVTESFWISAWSEVPKKIHLRFFSPGGTEVLNRHYSLEPGSRVEGITLPVGTPAGMYYLQISSGDQLLFTEKMVKL